MPEKKIIKPFTIDESQKEKRKEVEFDGKKFFVLNPFKNYNSVVVTTGSTKLITNTSDDPNDPIRTVHEYVKINNIDKCAHSIYTFLDQKTGKEYVKESYIKYDSDGRILEEKIGTNLVKKYTYDEDGSYTTEIIKGDEHLFFKYNKNNEINKIEGYDPSSPCYSSKNYPTPIKDVREISYKDIKADGDFKLFETCYYNSKEDRTAKKMQSKDLSLFINKRNLVKKETIEYSRDGAIISIDSYDDTLINGSGKNIKYGFTANYDNDTDSLKMTEIYFDKPDEHKKYSSAILENDVCITDIIINYGDKESFTSISSDSRELFDYVMAIALKQKEFDLDINRSGFTIFKEIL